MYRSYLYNPNKSLLLGHMYHEHHLPGYALPFTILMVFFFNLQKFFNFYTVQFIIFPFFHLCPLQTQGSCSLSFLYGTNVSVPWNLIVNDMLFCASL